MRTPYYDTNVRTSHADSILPARVTALEIRLDTIAPSILLTGGSFMTLNVGGTYVEQGARIIDVRVPGGSATDIGAASVSGTVDTSTRGTYIITYTGQDESGNAATPVTRTIAVLPTEDTTPPVIVLNGSANITLAYGATYTELGATVTDPDDPEHITYSAQAVGTVDTTTAGTYTITYSGQNQWGLLGTATRTVVVSPL